MNNEDEKQNGERTPAYAKYYDQVMLTLEILHLELRNGIIIEENTLKTDINDVVSSIVVQRAMDKQPQIPRHIIHDIVEKWIKNWGKEQQKNLLKLIKHDPRAPDRWDDMMKVVFGQVDEIDKLVLKHQVWIIKRRASRLPVDQRHRPLLLNIYGQKNVGKSLFLENYLFKPMPGDKIKIGSDMSIIFNDQRELDVLSNNLVISFGEKAKADKTNLEQLKLIIDSPTFSRRNLGSNSHSTLENNATLFSTSNRRLRDVFKDESPRKWYEISFLTRTPEQVQTYVNERDQIEVLDLWRCIDENKDSELLGRWNDVQARIDLRCRHIPDVVKWIYGYVEREFSLITFDKTIAANTIWEAYLDDNKANAYKVNQTTLGRRLRECGLYSKRKSVGVVYGIETEAYARIKNNLLELNNITNDTL